MSITEELRSWAHVNKDDTRIDTGLYGYDRLIRIADRIEEKLEDYIPLPKDVDGVTICIGDEVEVIGYEDGIVAALQLDERRWSVAVRPHGWDTPTLYDNESIRHAKPDSWERIISDAIVNGMRCQSDGRPSDFEALVERCKRLAGEDA